MKIVLELSTWGSPDGAALICWDYANGNDRGFILNPDGTAQELTEDAEPGALVDLVLALRAMLANAR